MKIACLKRTTGFLCDGFGVLIGGLYSVIGLVTSMGVHLCYKNRILITGVYLFTGCYHTSGSIYQCNGVSGNISDHNVLCVSVFVFEIRVYDKLIPA